MKAEAIGTAACGFSLLFLSATAGPPVALGQSVGVELAQQDNHAPIYSPPQLDQLLAPIALYPDSLLAQILMASTYPLEVVEAARWVQDPNNARLRGDQLDAALQPQTWDPSVKSLVPFPQVLQMMDSKLDWTQALGNAFLAQQADVMDSVQRLRAAGPGRRYAAVDPAGHGLDPGPGDRRSSPPIRSSSTCPTMTRRWSMAAGPIPIIRRSISRRRRITATWRGRASISASASALSARCGVGTSWDWGHHDIDIDPDRFNRINNYAIAHDNRPRDTREYLAARSRSSARRALQRSRRPAKIPAGRGGIPGCAARFSRLRQSRRRGATGAARTRTRPRRRRRPARARGQCRRQSQRANPVPAPRRRPGNAGSGLAAPQRGTGRSANPSRARTPDPPARTRRPPPAVRAARPPRASGQRFSVRSRRPSRASAKAPRFAAVAARPGQPPSHDARRRAACRRASAARGGTPPPQHSAPAAGGAKGGGNDKRHH